MTLYKKKPVTIEAVQYLENDPLSALEFLGLGNTSVSKLENTTAIYKRNDGVWSLDIKTLEGVMTVSNKDYIIKGVRGEFYPCKPDIFEETYEEVAEQQ